MSDKKVEDKIQKGMELKKVSPKKDFKFKHNKTVYDLKKGEDYQVPEIFIKNLKTEKVI